MGLIITGGVIISICVVVIFPLIVRMLVYLRMIVAFKGEYKETEATLTGGKVIRHVDVDYPR